MLKFDFLKKRSFRLIVLFVSALLTGLCVCYPNLGILQWISVAPAALVLYSLADSEKNRLRSVYLYGFFYYYCYFVAVWHWFFSMYPMDYTGMSAGTALLIVLLAVFCIPLIQASAFGFAFVLTVKLSRGRFVSRFSWLSPLVFSALWVVFEWAQTLFWFGVPWGRLALGQSELLVTLQSSSLFGSYFVTFLIVAVNALLALAIYKAEFRRLASISCAAIFSANLIFGIVAMAIPENKNETVKVAAIQGNISSTEKWGVDWRSTTFKSYSELTAKAAADGAELIVWPESVVLTYDSQSREKISEIARENNVTMLVGALPRVDGERYNSVITVLPDGTICDETYSKRHLVPFGEYVPWRELWALLIPALEDIGMIEEDIIPGKDSGVIETEYGKIGSLICFDSIYETLALASARDGAELIAIETNDSWFYDSAAVWMHEDQARMRAIETGRYAVRAANTGVSAIISPNGEIIDEIEPLVAGYITAEVGFISDRTLYSYVGNLWVWLSMGFVVCLASADTAIKIMERKRNNK